MSAGNTKIVLLAGALVLCVLLFIAPRTSAAGKAGTKEKTGGTASDIAAMAVFEKIAVKSMAPPDQARIEAFADSAAFDSLRTFWTNKKRPDMAALVTERKAMATKAAADYFEAGNRYYNAVRFSRDESAIPALYQSAIRCFKAGLETDPSNVDARIMLASSYVEGSQQPMEGIRLLQEVEKTDSGNVKLQLSFAFFSLKSGQPDKAEQRFRKVLRADSTYLEAYLHLADLYEQQGKTDSTIALLSRFASRTTDVTAKLEVNKYINQLKKQQTN